MSGDVARILSTEGDSVPFEEDLKEKIRKIAALWENGRLIVVLGPDLYAGGQPFPLDGPGLAKRLSERVAVPGRLSGRLHEIAQYIESHKHRKTLRTLMEEIFHDTSVEALAHSLLRRYPIPFTVDLWYSSASSDLLVPPGGHQISGVSRADYRERWFRIDRRVGKDENTSWEEVDTVKEASPVLYRPFGSMRPSLEMLISDADFVEVLTEIDIQTPIPSWVQSHRSGRHFLFLGCRFDNQTTRIFARQIMKRSSESHFAVADHALTQKERLFLGREGVDVLPVSLNSFFLPRLEECLGEANKKNMDATGGFDG